jgi:hypothetical protein
MSVYVGGYVTVGRLVLVGKEVCVAVAVLGNDGFAVTCNWGEAGMKVLSSSVAVDRHPSGNTVIALTKIISFIL